MWTGCSSLKVRSVSAGRTICLLPVKASPAVPAPATSERADGRALAAACERPDERSKTRSTANESRSALAFAFFRAIDGSGGDGIAAPVGVHAFKTNFKIGSALETAQRLGIDNGAVGTRTAGDHGLPVHDNVVGDRGGEGVARLRDLGSEILIETNANTACRREDQRLREAVGLRRGRSGWLTPGLALRLAAGAVRLTADAG